MSDTPPESPQDSVQESPATTSNSLRARLGSSPSQPPPKELSLADRKTLAEARLNGTLKGWRIVRLLGVGPVSAAYEAVRGAKDATERGVARVMIGEIGSHERAKSHFLRSAYAANRFQHSRVLPILEDGTDGDGIPFVVRPYADVEPLSHLLAKNDVFTPSETLRIGEQILDVLEMAHAHGIVHGSLTPSNILITSRRSIRLVDFGSPPGLAARNEGDVDVVANHRCGAFTAPERCTEPPQPQSEQSDIYSIGACLYYTLARTFPRGDVESRTELATLAARPLRELQPDVPENIAAVIDHALSFDPLNRYESAYAMLGDVRRVMAGRKPKLSDSLGPTPSQSATDMTAGIPPSSRRVPLTNRSEHPSQPPTSKRPPSKGQQEWRGNVVLILAIALLVGVATFVLVRERVEESRQDDDKTDVGKKPAPKASAPE
ncbi:MAG: serine/threonine-protein kinase [Polyangiaceae bacterium]